MIISLLPVTAMADDESDATPQEPAAEESAAEEPAVDEPTVEPDEELQARINALPDADALAEMDEDALNEVYSEIQAIYEVLDTLSAEEIDALELAPLETAAAFFTEQVEPLAGSIVISEDTTWNRPTTLKKNLIVNSGVTLTIGAQVTVSGDVTISGGGTIQRAADYTGEVENYTVAATDADGNYLDAAPETAHLFYVRKGSSLTLTDICIDGNAGWAVSNAAPEIDNKINANEKTDDAAVVAAAKAQKLQDYRDLGYNPVIGALICNMGELTLGDAAVLQNNFNFYQTDLSGTGLGGAVYNAGDMTVKDGAVIQYNSSRYGGAIRNEDGSTLLIEGGNIQYNNGSAGGAGVMANADMEFVMTGGVINGNSSPVNAGWPVGSGIFFGDGVKATLTGGSITNNVGYNYGAGIFVRFDSVKVDIGAVTLSGNQALNSTDPRKTQGLGGAIYVQGGDVTISGAIITDNTANQAGGGVAVGYDSRAKYYSVLITGDTVIKENKGGNGGGIYISDNAVCSISGNTKIENNTIADTAWSASKHGGGIYVAEENKNAGTAKGVLNISGNVAISNNDTSSTGGYGGGIFTKGDVNINGSNVVICNNSSACGGGIRGEKSASITVNGAVTISGNKATVYDGGGISAKENSSVTLSGKDIVIEGNTAKRRGGGIHFNGSQADSNLILKDITVKGGTLEDGAYNAVEGGGIAIEGAKNAVEIANVTISGNIALQNGGGIYLNGDAEIADTVISNNTAMTEDQNYGNGGGIYTTAAAHEYTIRNTEITKNIAKSTAGWLGGGGIYTGNSTILSLDNCTISENDAPNGAGGGINNRGVLEITNTAITNNTSKGYGGGVDHYGSSKYPSGVSLSGAVVIAENTAGNKDSNLYLRELSGQQQKTTLKSALTSGANIGVTAASTAAGTVVAEGTEEHTVTDADAAYFTHDGGKLIQKNDNQLVLADKKAGTNYSTVKIELPDNVTVNRATTSTVENGTYQLTFIPKEGYAVDTVKVNNVAVAPEADGTYKVTVTGDTTITVTEKALPVKVDPKTAEMNGVYGKYMEEALEVTATYALPHNVKSFAITSGKLPAGLELSADGVVSGTPEAVTDENGVKVTVEVTAQNDTTAEIELTVKIAKAEPKLSIAATPDSLRGGGKVTLTVTGVPEEGDVTVTCDNGITVTGNESAVLPNRTATYTFTANYEESENYTAASAKCEVSVTRRASAPSATTPEPEPEPDDGLPFTDVPKSAYFYDAVEWAVGKEITDGMSATMFGPYEPCARAQIVTFLWRAAGSPEPKAMSGFSDVPASAYYAKAVAWAVENGITNGMTETTFAPNATCTRGQSVTFLYRALGKKVESSANFTDVKADAFYADAVNWAVASGVTNGTSNTTFSPNEDCTRAEIVTFLYRAYQGK